MNATLLAILVYVLAQLGIGWWVSRRIKTEDDYLVAEAARPADAEAAR